jgi:hypothetical protein
VKEYHNPCTAWRQCLSPYLKGTVICQVWSDSPLKIRGVPPKAGRCYDVMENWELTRNREMGSREIRISNYKFSFCLFFFCRRRYSAMQRQSFCLSGRNGSDAFVRRSVTCGYEGYCLSGKSKPENWKLRPWWIFLYSSVFEGVFGLKSRIFITAEFILRHESPSETCLKGSTFPSLC